VTPTADPLPPTATPRPRAIVVEPDRFSPEAIAVLDEVADVELRPVAPADLPAAFAEHDVVWMRLAHRIGADELGREPRCRVLATPVTGLDHIDLDLCAAHGIEVVSLRGEVEFLRTVRATAEHTLALLLGLLRRLPAATRATAAGEWDRDRFPGHEIQGATVGVVGVGRLGTIVAGYLRALGAHVLGCDPRADFPHDAVDERTDLDDLLARSDVVTLHVSYSDATRHLIGATELARMRPHAVLVNTSRGGLVDEAALLHALATDALGGAALDVLDGEPAITPDHPVLRAAATDDRLLVTPHLGGNTAESFRRTEVFLAHRVVDALRRAAPVPSAPGPGPRP